MKVKELMRMLRGLEYFDLKDCGITTEILDALDAQSVVHGYWDDTITGVDGLYCCSACKNFETVDGGLNFCPNCGARMVKDDD